ncbi:cadherin EGF LAG seven-pass G-type receptor 2-like [Littorina saxatilis]|uniref:cadherin EGF LAG seven-pass G-type receptor 2-like n=1 Tax=Littorina saxatilis TaxID=31220 RepID=UPI0038B60396
MNDFNTLNHILRNTVNLDRETVERYILVLRAEDTAGNANDTDKASTTFSNVSYSIEPENNDFNVNSESGQITSLRPFDFETEKIFTFTVLATDGGGNIGVARVIVRVRDLQDNIPVFDRNFTFYVDEGVIGVIVGQVTATDMDTTDNIQYQFDSGEYGNFSINGTTGEIRTIQALDYNVKNQYIFTVTTSDGSAIDPSSSSTVTVIVNDVNNFTPVITVTPNNTVYLLENANASTVVVDVNADDGDSQNTSSGRITFSIESSTPGSGRPYFTIDPVSGVLTVAGSLKEAPEDLYTLLVRASDAGSSPRWAESNITVHILRNTPPSFNNPTVTIPELRVDQTTVNYIVSAVDPDTISEFRVTNYRLDGDSTATRFFQVSNNVETDGVVTNASITITDRAGLTGDNNTEYRLEVVVEDGAGESARQTLLLPFRRNVYPPTFLGPSSVTITVNETQQLDVPILTVSVTDQDLQAPNNHVECFLEADAETLAYFKVAKNGVNTCDISVRSPLYSDFNRKPQYNLQIVARDGGSTPQTAAVNLTVNVNRNQNTPQFINVDSYPRTIDENMLVGTSVTQVTATDEDIVEQLVYEKIGDDEAVYFFDVDRLNGIIYLVNGLLTDNKTSYSLRVQAYDTAYPEQKTSVTVQIQVRRNEYSPVFAPSPITVTIEETVQIGSVITIVNATDQDAMDTLRYSSESDTGTLEALQLFDLNPDSGAVRVRASLLNLPRDLYFVQVRATDDGIGQKSGTVTVFININRHPGTPVLSPDPCGTSVSENTAVGTTVLTLTAADNNSALRLVAYDSARTNRRDVLVCTINVARNQNGPQWNPENYIFEIPENQPYISNIGNVSAFDVDPDLLLEACDNGLPQRCVNVTLQVNVNRTGQYPVCHYPPTSSSFVATILESATSGSFVMRINASDEDAKGGLVYELVYPYPIALSINTASGDITLEETIDDDQEKTVDIEVLVYDPADPGRQTRCNGTIFITRNLYGPFFSRSPYRATISEYHIVSDQVVTINAADRDGAW